MKDSRVEKPKSRPQKSKAPAPQHFTNNAKTSKQARKEKKKKEKQERRNRKRRRRNKRDVTKKEGLRILPQSLGSIVPVLAKKRVKEMVPTIETQARSPVETVAKKDTTLTSTLNHSSQKTIVSLGNLRVGDWC